MNLYITTPYRLSVMITHEKKISFCRLRANYKLLHNQTILPWIICSGNLQWYLRISGKSLFMITFINETHESIFISGRISRSIQFKLIQSTSLVQHKSLNIKHVTNQWINVIFSSLALHFNFFLFYFRKQNVLDSILNVYN